MGNIIQFRSRAEWEKDKRENMWQEWLEWKKWEEDNAGYQNNKEDNGAVNFDDPANVDEYYISKEDEIFLEQEMRTARKEIMRNNDEDEHNELNLTRAEWEWLGTWMDEDF